MYGAHFVALSAMTAGVSTQHACLTAVCMPLLLELRFKCDHTYMYIIAEI